MICPRKSNTLLSITERPTDTHFMDWAPIGRCNIPKKWDLYLKYVWLKTLPINSVWWFSETNILSFKSKNLSILFSVIYQTSAVTLYFSMFVVVCLICWALFLLMLSHLCLRSKMGGVNDSIEHLEQFLLDTKEILHPNNYQVFCLVNPGIRISGGGMSFLYFYSLWRALTLLGPILLLSYTVISFLTYT